jgi:HD superfamily phosphohydrolase
MQKLAASFPSEVAPYRAAVTAAATLHDIGHLAPGSHTAFRTWFPNSTDIHEQLAIGIIRSDDEIRAILGAELTERVVSILEESSSVPAWTWEIISGGGWNVDRGNWCIIDSILAGVQYGQYNIPALTDSIVITDSGHLALKENRLDAMMHFAVSRHAMYRQVYQHRVLLAADMLNRAVVQRARDIGAAALFADETMQTVLECKDPGTLTAGTIFSMRECWWRYHLMRWRDGQDAILADLASRLLDRRLLKTVRVPVDSDREQLWQDATKAVTQAGYDPRYYLHEISTFDMQAGDLEQSMSVLLDNGKTLRLTDADPLFNTLLRETKAGLKRWYAMPAKAKEIMGTAARG